MNVSAESPSSPPRWRLVPVVAAVGAVLAGMAVGIHGLLGDPVQSSDHSGRALLAGIFEPYSCPGCVVPQGYVQAGGRSVFIRFPSGCHMPAAGSTLTVLGTPAPDLGRAAYRAVSCVH